MTDIDQLPFDRTRVADAVRQYPLEQLYARAARRRRRRTASLALTVAALVAAGMVFTMPPRVSVPSLPLTDTPPPPPLTASRPTRLTLLSPDTAVAVWAGPCELRFAFTTDAGRGWSAASGPAPASQCDPLDPSAGPDAFVIDAQTYLASVQGADYLTTDAGHTWRPAASAFVDVAAFPSTARVMDCGSSRCFTHSATPYAVDTSSGAVYRLISSPAGLRITAYQQADGILWATLFGTRFDSAAVGWSADGGATWQTSPVPAKTGAEGVFAVDRHRAYVPYTPDSGAPMHVLSTADAGRTWQDVTTDMPVTDHVRDFTATSDGALLLADSEPAGAWISRDGGAHFTRSTPPEVGIDTPTAGAGPGLAYIAISGPATVYVTTDANRWTTFPLMR
ncbi:hypothetical protein [Dactylosporangium sp. NPDC048998]|uniref:sialidase family protein n=1 Tax=Dactylosporangium sp. NPDC048998 TaxID=3363976 RepID=UPI003723B41F